MNANCPTKVHELYRARTKIHYAIPLYSCAVSAGFPSPADEYLEGKLDLNQHLIHHPLATVLVRVPLRLTPTRGRTAILSGYRESRCSVRGFIQGIY